MTKKYYILRETLQTRSDNSHESQNSPVDYDAPRPVLAVSWNE